MLTLEINSYNTKIIIMFEFGLLNNKNEKKRLFIM